MPIEPRRRIFRRANRRVAVGLRVVALALLTAGVAGFAIDLIADWFGPAARSTSQISAPADHVAVLDGDTLRVQGTVVRLAGVAAPTQGEFCGHGGGDCADLAARALAAMMQAHSVQCALVGQDALGRPTGRCEAGGRQLNRAVVESGWARAATIEYRPAEQEARASHRGLWATTY